MVISHPAGSAGAAGAAAAGAAVVAVPGRRAADSPAGGRSVWGGFEGLAFKKNKKKDYCSLSLTIVALVFFV